MQKIRSYRIANYCGVLYTVGVIGGVVALVLLYVCPATYGDGQCSGENMLGALIVSELLLNFICFIKYSSQNDPQRWIRKAAVDVGFDVGITQQQAKYCMECDRTAPKRSHHCPLCNMCVLRKDHHCFMTGACVGIANQRYFIVFVLWAGIGAGIGAYYILMYLLKFVEPQWYPFGFVKFIAPVAVARWINGSDSLLNTGICILFSMAAASSVVASVFFGSQMYFTLMGYTAYDYSTLSRRCELEGDGETLTERLNLVFGAYWPLNFIFPQVWFKNILTPNIARNILISRAKNL
uniref:Palmitoyltransferase n=1 Tax=Syphacia muris TaxID=451379 RepID=A0A0N5A986_9BILA